MSAFRIRDLKVVHRLGLFAAFQFLMFIAAFLVVMVQMQRIDNGIYRVVEEDYPSAIHAEEAARQLGAVNEWLTDVAATHRRDGFKDAEAAAIRFRELIDTMLFHARKDDDQKAIKALTELRSEFESMYELGKKMAETYVAKGLDAGNIIMEDFDKRSDKLRSLMTKWSDAEVEQAKASAKAIYAETHSLVRNVIWIAIAAGVIGGIIVYFFARSFARPIEEASRAARLIADGNLTIKMPHDDRGDEIGVLLQSLDHMMTMLKTQAEEINEGTSNLAAAIAEISSTASELAASSSETASTIHEVGTTVAEVRHIAHVANEKTSSMVNEAQDMRHVAKGGRQAADDATSGIRDIRQEMENIAKTTVELGEHTQNIGEIIDAVNDITDQTNLLSVNASIEAAKAGEVGRGFAVVAQEMKRLTSQAKEATTQIETILGDIQKVAGRAVMAAERGGKAVERGVLLTNKAGESIVALDSNVNASAAVAEQIGASSTQQLMGMDQLVQAMDNIKTATQQNVDGAKQLESATRNLNELAQRLRKLTQRITV
jgi:methyl-accepting chemotaxis protein